MVVVPVIVPMPMPMPVPVVVVVFVTGVQDLDPRTQPPSPQLGDQRDPEQGGGHDGERAVVVLLEEPLR
ncbi:MAG: hypothetical protein AAF721_27985, partial [Myxococcota bacterium]